MHRGFPKGDRGLRPFPLPFCRLRRGETPACGKDQLCLKDQLHGRAHLARHSIGVGKSSLGALLRKREVTGRDASLPALLLSAFGILFARGTVGALPQTPQGTLSLDPAKGQSPSRHPLTGARLGRFSLTSLCRYFFVCPSRKARRRRAIVASSSSPTSLLVQSTSCANSSPVSTAVAIHRKISSRLVMLASYVTSAVPIRGFTCASRTPRQHRHHILHIMQIRQRFLRQHLISLEAQAQAPRQVAGHSGLQVVANQRRFNSSHCRFASRCWLPTRAASSRPEQPRR